MYSVCYLKKKKTFFVSHIELYDKPITLNFLVKYVLANIRELQDISVERVLSSTQTL